MALTVIEPLDARIPQWGIDCLLVRRCPFCGTENRSALMRPDKLPVAFCNTCGCWYVSGLPNSKEIKKLYDGYYHDHRPTDLSDNRVIQMLENAQKESKSDWQLQLLLRLLGSINNKRILDVGCGWGHFLLMARFAGADVVGCDLSPEACEFANNKLGITVYHSELSSCMSSVGYVDAIVMRDLIEHPVNPFHVIQAAYRILKPGGLILLHTPNGGEAGTDVETAKKWVGFRVDLEHLQYLSPCTINWLARMLDIRIEQLDTFGFPALKGIDELPKCIDESSKRRSWNLDKARDIAKKIFYMRKIIKALLSEKAERKISHHDPRLGSYHLFAVLRKI